MANNNFFDRGTTVNRDAFAQRHSLKYQPYVYQGDNSILQRMGDAPAASAGASLISGSICSITDSYEAVSGCAAGVAGNHPVPCLVMNGTETEGVASQIGNIAGGVISTISLAGYYRVVTQAFDTDSSITYATNDLLTVRTVEIDGVDTAVVSKLNDDGEQCVPYTDVIVGIVDRPAYEDTSRRMSLQFTAYFLPATEASASASE